MISVVTGGAGFIGSHLVEHLLKLGQNVTVIDNLSTGRLANLAHLRENPRLIFQQADISEWGTLDAYFKGADWVFHIAALADIVPSIQNPVSYYRSNVDGTANVLEAARAAGVKRFVYVASSSCYGIPDVYPTPETAEIKPQYPYALTKYLGEQTVLHWGKIYKLPVVCLRLFNIYGPRSRTSGTYGAVFGVFLSQKLHNQSFTVVGDGKQTRDFTFVSDVVNALVTVAESDVVNEVMNALSGQYDIAHGDGLAALLPEWMKFTAEAKPERFVSLGMKVFGESDGIRATEKWLETVRMKLKLGQLGVKADKLDELANNAIKTAPWMKYHPRTLDAAAIKEIYRKSL